MEEYCPHRRTLVLLVTLLFLFSPKANFAQTPSATISGTVQDENKALLGGVAISVKNVETGITRIGNTDSEGRYRVTQLPPGNYELQAVAKGFRTAVRTGIDLSVGRDAVVDFALNVGEVSAKS